MTTDKCDARPARAASAGSPATTTRSSSARSRGRLRLTLRTCDVASFAVAWTIAWLLAGQTADAAVAAAAGVAAALVLCAALGLYRTACTVARAVAYTRLIGAAAGSAATVAVAQSMLVDRPGLALPVLGGAVALALSTTARYSFDWWLRRSRAAGSHRRAITVIGAAPEIQAFHGFLTANPELGYAVVATVGGDDDPGIGVPWYPRVADARVAVAASDSTGAVILASALSTADVNSVARELTASHIPVQLHTGLQGFSYRRLRPMPVGYEPFLSLQGPSESRVQLAAKRAFDIVGASVLLLLSAPVTVVAALAIKLHDRGPVIFTQTRVGQDGKPIRVHKLRTMAPDAESRLAEIKPLNERMGPLFKTEADPRVTRVGKMLRRTSIDEIPQLFDVLRGDMSLVGPRPALPEEVASFDDALLARLRVRPGVTGLWQVEARDKPSFDAYRRLDLFYVENWSFLLDLAIVIDTIPSVADHAIRGLVNVLRRHEVDLDVSDATPESTETAVLLASPSTELATLGDSVAP